jgi:transposase
MDQDTGTVVHVAEGRLAWFAWAIRSRLEPVRRVANMIKSHLNGILNAIVLGVTNAQSEGVNSKIQWIKYTARGFRNRLRFRTAIYFHLGGLDLYPDNPINLGYPHKITKSPMCLVLPRH